MRATIPAQYDEADRNDWLTTGEAGALLGVSRQHVVNLCSRGDLPFEFVGAHRRIRRADLERYRNGSVRMSPDQHRSWRLGIAIAAQVALNPDTAIATARRNLDVMRSRHPRGQAAHWLNVWDELLDGPVDAVLTALTSPTGRSRELRQNSPFAGLLSDSERQQILRAA